MRAPQEPKPAESLELQRRVSHVEQRDFQLWSIALLLMVVLAAGFLALVAPNITWRLGLLRASGRYVPQLFFGFIALVVLGNIYLIAQRKTIASTREALIREMMARQSAEQLSLMDSLTETYNRRYLHEVISKDFSRAQRQGTPLTFVMVDVDQFKSVNTRFGHLVGDRVLTEVAHVLKITFRAADTIIRYGGDEFLVLLEGCDEAHARAALERLERRVADWNRGRLITGFEMKLSCGYALHRAGESADAVLQRADDELMRRKSQPQAAPPATRG